MGTKTQRIKVLENEQDLEIAKSTNLNSVPVMNFDKWENRKLYT